MEEPSGEKRVVPRILSFRSDSGAHSFSLSLSQERDRKRGRERRKENFLLLSSLFPFLFLKEKKEKKRRRIGYPGPTFMRKKKEIEYVGPGIHPSIVSSFPARALDEKEETEREASRT